MTSVLAFEVANDQNVENVMGNSMTKLVEHSEAQLKSKLG